MLRTESLQFLYEISQNNNRDWFEKNKKRYETSLKKPFEALVGELILSFHNLLSSHSSVNSKTASCSFSL
jgi:uncharacterized protein (DUF2461 family)